MKFTIIGSAFTGNKGAAAMLESSIQTLTNKYPDTQFTLLSASPKTDKKLNTYPNVTVLKAKPLYLGTVINSVAILYKILPFLRKPLGKLVPEVKAIHESDALLDEGGITFSDGREYYLIYNIATILPALVLGTKVIKVSQALGSFNGKINRFFSKMFLPRISLIVARGEQTHKYLLDLGLTNVKPAADYAFSLEMTEESKRSAQQNFSNHNALLNQFKGKVVGISPSEVVKQQMEKAGMNYKEKTLEFINWLTSEGYLVALIPHSVKLYTNKTHNNDLPLTKDLFESIENKSQIIFVDNELDSQQLRYIIGQCDYFVASRFHAMISSLAMAVPTMVVGWSHKYAEVLKMFELEQYVMGYKEVELTRLQNLFNKLVQDKAEIKSKIEKNLPAVKKSSLSQVEFIAEVLNK